MLLRLLPALEDTLSCLHLQGAADRPTNREHLSLAGSALSLAVPGSSPSAPELAEAAAGALAEYLRSGAIYTLDLLPLPAVAALAAHAKYGPLHKLVAAVLAGDVAGESIVHMQ